MVDRDPASDAERLERSFALRARRVLLTELGAIGLTVPTLDLDLIAELVIATGFAALVSLLRDRDVEGSALRLLAGVPDSDQDDVTVPDASPALAEPRLPNDSGPLP